MRRRELLTAMTAAMFAPTAARTAAVAQAAPVKIRVVGSLTEDVTPLFYAIKTGAFARVGLDVELVAATTGSPALAAVVSGSYEVAKTGLPGLFFAHLREVPLAILAPEAVQEQRNTFALLVVAADSPLRTGSDLNGKIMGVPGLNDLSTLAIRAWSDKNGGDWRSLKFVETPSVTMVAALQQHRVDAVLLQTPYLEDALKAGIARTIGDAESAIAPTFLGGAYVARIDWMSAHRDIVRAFNRAFLPAAAYVNTHLLQTASYVSALTQTPIADAAALHRTIAATSLEPAQIQVLIDASAKYEILPHGFPARELLID